MIPLQMAYWVRRLDCLLETWPSNALLRSGWCWEGYQAVERVPGLCQGISIDSVCTSSLRYHGDLRNIGQQHCLVAKQTPTTAKVLGYALHHGVMLPRKQWSPCWTSSEVTYTRLLLCLWISAVFNSICLLPSPVSLRSRWMESPFTNTLGKASRYLVPLSKGKSPFIL